MLAQDADPLGLEEGMLTPRRLEGLLRGGEDAPTRIGPYRIVRLLGEGGFGLVYEAEQTEPLRRRVALKVLRAGMDSSEIIARFETERRALAVMDHPAIARVLDAGTTDAGRPYFVMELVDGVPITEYCHGDRGAPDGLGRRSTRECLELFVHVCLGVQHAHQKGVIHRDIKPSNLLISVHDGRPLPKVIDFGIAKATWPDMSGGTVLTRLGRLMGTPEYMSPEQADGGETDVDTRSDIYSLGAVLYEILTGVTPLDRERLRSASYSEIRRMLTEEQPARPSTRLSRTSDTTWAPADAPPVREFRRELDWIVMKCLEKDRSRRYDSAGDLAADINRYLRHEPILAGPPGTGYRVRKFARRHQVGLVAASLIAIALVIGAIGTNLGLIEARRSERTALRQAYRAGISAGADAVEQHRVDVARQHLDDCPPDLRGWEWRHLEARIDQSVAQHTTDGLRRAIVRGPGDASYFVFLDRIVRGGVENVIEERSVETGEVLQSVVVESAAPWAGRLVKGPTGEPLLVTLELAPRMARFVVRDASDLANTLTTSLPPSGGVADAIETTAAYRHGSDLVEVADLATGAVRGGVRFPVGVSEVRLSPEGSLIGVADVQGAIALIDADVPAMRTFLDTEPVDGAVLEFSPDASTLAIGTRDGVVQVWDVRPRHPILIATLRGHTGAISDLDFSPDGSTLASAGVDATVRLWRRRDGAPLVMLAPGVGPLATARFLDDRRLVAAGLDDDGIRILDATAHATITLRGHANYVNPVRFTPDDDMIISGGWDGWVGQQGALRWWDASTGDPVAAAFGPGEVVIDLDVSGDGSMIAAALTGSVNQLRVLDARTGGLVGKFELDDDPISIALSADGSYLVCGDRWEGILRVVSIPDGREVARHQFSQSVVVSRSNDGALIAVASHDDADRPVIALLDAHNFEIVRRWTAHDDNINSIAFDSASERLLTTSVDATARVWDVATGRELGVLRGHGLDVLCGVFSPDARRIATGARDGNVRIWDARTFEQLVRLGGHEDYVYSLDFSSDGECLVSGSGDGTVRIWDTRALSTRLASRAARLAAVKRLRPIAQHALDQAREASDDDLGVVTPAALASAARLIDENPSLDPEDRRIAHQLLLGRLHDRH